MGEWLTFIPLAVLIISFAIVVVTHNNPVVSAIFLVLDLFCLAGVYATLGADFVAAIQIIVYAGAIVVLFVFVIMLLNLNPHKFDITSINPLKVFMSIGLALCFLYIAWAQISQSTSDFQITESQWTADNTQEVGLTLFTSYVWPFELASILILLSLVACIVISRKQQIQMPDNQTHKRKLS